MPPTPETWTISLPHRTQVVYTPDYSYVLQRLRVRPGDTLIEAGAGSGSFTHASCRAVFNGYPQSEPSDTANGVSKKRKRRHGHVYSFEYHEPRAEALRKEVKEHGLDQLVTVTHRDVYADGFNIEGEDEPQANAVFLDLPAPWLALRHLTRTPPPPPKPSNNSTPVPGDAASSATSDSKPFRSPLNPHKTTYLCTFSPCIEQVQRTTTEMRRIGWQDIEMVEVLHKRIDVRRERVGLQEEGLRGVNAVAATVDEALGRLREVEGRFREYHRGQQVDGGADAEGDSTGKEKKPGYKETRLQKIKEKEKERKTWKEGRLVHRTEPEIKTHTSYLCFAVLPRLWTAEDEEKARKKWGNKVEAVEKKQ
ncbi:tRNA methyltransferase complex GCD14 subunit [Saccharata proteae CBS 121410]|uniref:tRNA (adenine(58)-N(1))-methyltransferase catalytic subunit TRM61 n=1 Tax=Saccharata proteae CBS 121410 TaxID=1314787 RepID=A0A9P4HW93_9PEZI|nr:tRNA methyltransferase complex GCD14 subunit [Saccharata proteae CBS 121410]